MSAPNEYAIYQALMHLYDTGAGEPLRARVNAEMAAGRPIPPIVSLTLLELLDRARTRPSTRRRGRPRLDDDPRNRLRNPTRVATDMAYGLLQGDRMAGDLLQSGQSDYMVYDPLQGDYIAGGCAPSPERRDEIIDLAITCAVDAVTKYFPGIKINNPPTRERVEAELREPRSRWSMLPY